MAGLLSAVRMVGSTLRMEFLRAEALASGDEEAEAGDAEGVEAAIGLHREISDSWPSHA